MIASALLLLGGCNPIDLGAAFLDGPSDVAVLPGGPFEEPVGFVSNMRSGRIIPLDIKAGRYLSDNIAAPFLSPRGIATGDQRQLGPIVPFSPNGDDVTVFAVDLAGGQLIEAPYILSVGDTIEIQGHTITDPVFEDVDGSGESVEIIDINGNDGRTTTEDWTLSFDGERWWVDGSRSGRQGASAEPFVPYRTDNLELEFTVDGTGTVGDRITFSTDTGLIEHDLGGTVVDVQRLPELPYLAAAVYDSDAELGWVSLFDMSASAEVGRVALPAGAQAWRIATGAAATDLYVADAQQAAVYTIDLNPTDPATSAVTAIETAAPLVDVAWVGDEGYSNLFVAVAGKNRVDVYDLDARAWRDVNPYDDLLGGVNLQAPVVGLSASDGRIELQEQVEWGTDPDNRIYVHKKIVALTTADGSLVMLEGDSGCLAKTLVGPGTSNTEGTADYTYSGAANPSLSLSPATGDAIQTLPCGGMLLEENWTVTYDGAQGSWEVEGTRSGTQANRAYEDQRYISDDGALSFTILSGTVPSSDGDQYSFTSEDGVLMLNAVELGSGFVTSLEAPGTPLVFTYRSGRQGGGWDRLQENPYALVPILNSNIVLRVRLDTWVAEIAWE